MKIRLAAVAFTLLLATQAHAQDYAILGPEVATALASQRTSELGQTVIANADAAVVAAQVRVDGSGHGRDVTPTGDVPGRQDQPRQFTSKLPGGVRRPEVLLLLEGWREGVDGRRGREFPTGRRCRPLRDDSPPGGPVAADGTDSDHLGGSCQRLISKKAAWARA